MTSSFIICTMNRPDDLFACVDSIKLQTILPQEFIIVDAGNTGNLEQGLRERLADTGIRLIYQKAEPSTARQRNIGVDISSGEIIFFLDDDVILENDYNERMLEVYKEYEGPNLGGVCSTIVNSYIDSFLRNWFNRLFFLNHTLKKGKGRFLPSGNYAFIPCPETIVEVEGMSGCCCSYYRKVLLEYRFDDSWSGYALKEDLELSYRVSRRYKLYQTPFARLVHNCSPVARIKVSDFVKKMIVNDYLMFKKNIPKTPINIVVFLWSNAGNAILTFLQSMLKGNSAYMTGYIAGVKEIVRIMLSRKGQNLHGSI